MEYAGLFYNLIVGVMSLCGGLLFTWWWLIIGKASDVYHYTTAMLYGIAAASLVNIFVLHLVFVAKEGCPPVTAAEIATQWWYIFRHAPEHIAMICIVIAMVKRTIKILRNSRVKKKPLPGETVMGVVSTLGKDPYVQPDEDEEGR